jgi:hypothetical protein
MISSLQGRQMRWNYFQDVDFLTLKVFRKKRRTLGPGLRNNVQAAARNQSGEKHGVPQVRGYRRHDRVIHTRAELQPFHNPQNVIHDVPVFDTNALGTPG